MTIVIKKQIGNITDFLKPVTAMIWDLFKWASVISVIIGYLVVSFWILYPYKPLVFHAPFEIQNEVVHPGDVLFYRFQATKNISVPVTVIKQLINTVVLTCSNVKGNYPAGEVDNPAGEVDSVFSVIVPAFAPVGTYTFLWSGTYQVNPIRRITVTNRSGEFEVVARELIK